MLLVKKARQAIKKKRGCSARFFFQSILLIESNKMAAIIIHMAEKSRIYHSHGGEE